MEEKREVLSCPVKCEKSVVIAYAPKRILPKVPVTEDLLAHVILSKFDDRQPLYHLEKQFASRHGINISRQNLSRWVVDAAKPLIPLLNGLKDSIIEHDIASIRQEKTLPLLNNFKQWLEEDKKTYAAAQRRGLLDDKSITGHLIKTEGKPISKWTKNVVLEDALLDDTRSAWKLRSPAAYRASRDRGYFDEAVKHMTLMGNKYKRCILSLIHI